jgi:hypothetical protein
MQGGGGITSRNDHRRFRGQTGDDHKEGYTQERRSRRELTTGGISLLSNFPEGKLMLAPGKIYDSLAGKARVAIAPS